MRIEHSMRTLEAFMPADEHAGPPRGK
jgi:hypothetical protein